MRNTLSRYPTWDEINERAKYVNGVTDHLDYGLSEIQSDLEARNTYLYNILTKDREDKWMEGLTTSEIDSVRVELESYPRLISHFD